MSKPLFDPADTNLAQLFMRAFYWADEGLQNALKQKGWPTITRAQSLVFVNIGEGVTRPSDIASRVGVTRQAIHQTINELVEMGFLKLEPDPRDRRAKVVVFTETGAKIGGDAVDALQQIEQSLSSRIGGERVLALREALTQEWGDPFQPV
ncbi:MAG: MarR family transcriptional regulator [Gammaproteobacteria bacterium]|jgi:DNA-binding MarR family transcriptional regulator|nr:MarR family transcriptional regulator [Gammaproteobacteria bacterium]